MDGPRGGKDATPPSISATIRANFAPPMQPAVEEKKVEEKKKKDKKKNE
jgi:hypothetical protein